MTITLLDHTKLSSCASAIRQCWQSQDKGGCYPIPTDDIVPADQALIERVVLQHKHASTAEHLVYQFHISGISRACLQELARHRIASLSVESTRYTLAKKLRLEQPFLNGSSLSDSLAELDLHTPDALTRAQQYIKFVGIDSVDIASLQALDNLRDLVEYGISTDLLKYALPESWLVNLSWTINARSLQNFLELRSSPAALWEIRDLSTAIYAALPSSHQFLFNSNS